MTSTFDPPLDYAAVGLVSGLEVHQQLLTDRKLFCHCPAGRYTKTHDGTVLRHMRPTLSELGVYDGTALMEFKTRKHIIYLLNRENTCTYEMDDTPPFPVNQGAVDVAIEQCLMLGCDIVDEVHIARKQYLDGSIPTGFQRTAIVGVNGKLPFRGRELSITQVSVEEDSCREVSDKGHLIVWRTDRLGMPLIETVTGPDLRTPDEVAEAILLVGRVCRSTRHVRVGMGASRQDVNVSVRGGRRVEIKGVPKAGWAPRLVHGEAWRQVNLLRLRDELHLRGFRALDDVRVRDHGRDRVRGLVVPRARCGRRAGSGGSAARAAGRSSSSASAPSASSPCASPASPARSAGRRSPGGPSPTSWPGRVRVIAGLDQPPILFHSEAWPREAGEHLARLRAAAGCDEADGLVLVWGPERDVHTAADEIRLRYGDATDGVPNETRQPKADGSTDFERILPGPDRMYPDTDSPPTRVTRERVDRLRTSLPERPWQREERYREAGVPTGLAHYLVRRGGAALVDRVVAEAGAELRSAAHFFGERLKGLRRDGVAVDRVPEDGWVELFRAFAARPARRDAWEILVRRMAARQGESVSGLLGELGLDSEPHGWRAMIPRWVAAAEREAYDRDPGRVLRHATGQVMNTLRGRVPAALVIEAVREAAEVSR